LTKWRGGDRIEVLTSGVPEIGSRKREASAVLEHPEAWTTRRLTDVAEHSVSPPAVPSIPQELLAERVEAELDRLRDARPALADRLDRAAGILLLQLSSPPRLRPVRVRISKDGTAKFLVNSATVGGGVYVVDPKRWECNCPDAHRRLGKGCKHSITCYVLERVARVPRKGCRFCRGGWVYIGEEIVDPESGEIAEAINPVRCRRCGDGLSHSYVREWLESQRWIYARSRPSNPHEYCLRREADDEATFERIVEHIRELGHPYPWWGAVYRQYVAGDFAYWTMGSPLHETQLINRKTLEQVRLDQLTNRGGARIVWPWLHIDVEAERAG
jgi:hypothetical protein